jgi:hypothetical protein
MSGYAFHPEPLADLTEYWGYIAERNVNALPA